jgi:hypothetical protein
MSLLVTALERKALSTTICRHFLEAPFGDGSLKFGMWIDAPTTGSVTLRLPIRSGIGTYRLHGIGYCRTWCGRRISSCGSLVWFS